MSRQSPHRSPASVAVLLTAALLLGWTAPPALAQQSPDRWTAERRAVLPSGLAVQLDFAPATGVTATPGPGTLADRAGSGSGSGGGSGGSASSGPVYSDGLRPGDPAETFLMAEQHPHLDGAWHPAGRLKISFSRAVRNPRLHVSGLAAAATPGGGGTTTATRLTVAAGVPNSPTLTARTAWPGWTASAGRLAPADGGPDTDGSGSVELTGTVSSVTLQVELRDTARSGGTAAPPSLRQAYTVTLDEGLGSAPEQYTNASHLVSDLFLGQDAANGAPAARPTQAGRPHVSRPLVELGGPTRPSPFARPAGAAAGQPGRGDYRPDPTLKFPAEAAVGQAYDLVVPVSTGAEPAVLVGWIDFDHSGRFEPTDRVQAEIPAGAASGTLEWTVPEHATGGETWARLRLARADAQLIAPGGFADSGEVVDQKIKVNLGPPRPELTSPVDGAATADQRPELRGGKAMPGASVSVQEGDATLCRASAGSDGGWSCRPDTPLAQGAHTLTPLATTRAGSAQRGEPIRLTVKTTPPAAPVLTLPEYTNDPGLPLTGTGEAAATVTVTDGTGGRSDAEVCRTAVKADGSWSCLPVDDLTDGRHRLTPSAVDRAGNRTDGKSVTLTVSTKAPGKPVLAAPTAGATVQSARPKLSGRADAGGSVAVTARPAAGGDPVTLCTTPVAADGSWSCTPTRDLAAGDQQLMATVTDRAGNTTAGDPVPIHVAPPKPGASPTRSSSPRPSPTPSLAATATRSAWPRPTGSADQLPPPANVSGRADPQLPPGLFPILVPQPAVLLPPVPFPAELLPRFLPIPVPLPFPIAVLHPSGPPTVRDLPPPLPAAPAAAPVAATVAPGGASYPGSRRVAAAGAGLILLGAGLLARRVLRPGPGVRRR